MFLPYSRKNDYIKQPFLISFIRFYQVVISPYLGNRCRFYPSCSNYAIQSIEKYGLLKGGFLSFRRIFRCHPFHKGGYDPVP